MPDLPAYKKTKSKVFIKFSGNLVIDFSTKTDLDNVVVILTKATQIGNRWCPTPLSSMHQLIKSVQQAVSINPFAFTNMIMHRTKIAHQSGHGSKQGIVQTICQIMLYNMTKNTRYRWQIICHSVQRETPLPVYLDFMTHSHTRKHYQVETLCELVKTLHRLGLSISYDRLVQISASKGNRECLFFEKYHVVCPPQIKTSVFTTACVDSTDHKALS